MIITMPPPLSSPPPQFDAVPATLSRDCLQPSTENLDRDAISKLNVLTFRYSHYAQRRYRGWGSWGFTVLRTVYTPESDILFPLAMERLRPVVEYWCHWTRFPGMGASCQEYKVEDTTYNDELFRRFWLDVVEDREGLGGLDSSSGRDEGERFGMLAEYFRRWCEGTDTQSDTGDVRHKDPRFTSCLVVDGESLAALVQIPEEVPPLRCATTRAEKADWLGTGYPGWLWLVEARFMALPAEQREDVWGGSRTYPGWLRVEPRDLFSVWTGHWALNDSDREACLSHAKAPEGSGVYVYSPR